MSIVEESPIEMAESQRSGVATASLICSLIICCPITTFLGPILGLIALIQLKGKPHISGKRFAWSGIVIGVVTSVVWIVGSLIVVDMGLRFLERAQTISTETIQAGYDGDYKTFRTKFSSNVSSMSDEEIKTFVNTLQTRYGNFDSLLLDMDAEYKSQETSSLEAYLPIQFIFETEDASGYVMFDITPITMIEYYLSISYIEINDSKHGELFFPTGAKSLPVQESSEESEDTSTQ